MIAKVARNHGFSIEFYDFMTLRRPSVSEPCLRAKGQKKNRRRKEDNRSDCIWLTWALIIKYLIIALHIRTEQFRKQFQSFWWDWSGWRKREIGNERQKKGSNGIASLVVKVAIRRTNSEYLMIFMAGRGAGNWIGYKQFWKKEDCIQGRRLGG